MPTPTPLTIMQTLRFNKAAVFCLLLYCCSFAAIATSSQGQVTQDTTLKNQPSMQAQVSGTVTAKQEIEVFKRQGGWYQINTTAESPQQGWLPLFFVRFTKQAYQPDNLRAPSLGDVFKTEQQVTSATGVRGLNRGQIEASTGDFNALAVAQQWSLNAAQVQPFVTEMPLMTNADIQVEVKP